MILTEKMLTFLLMSKNIFAFVSKKVRGRPSSFLKLRLLISNNVIWIITEEDLFKSTIIDLE